MKEILRMRLSVIAIVLCVYTIHTVISAAIEPIVQTSQGKLKGKLGESRNGRKYVQYLGIPYAQKPLRFQEAGPPEKWDTVRDATKFGSPCIQFDRKTKGTVGSEDCLFLNVYTPQVPKPAVATSIPSTITKSSASSTTVKPGPPSSILKSAGKLPVLVYIHGGSFVSQSGHIFGAKYFMDEDVVLITLNYRLGVLGFLSTGDSDSIANLGLRDQILALKWIQENIEQFGGDRSRVTLMGGSAGGALASYLMLSPLAKGLFSGVISQSGVSTCPWVVVRHPAKVAAKLSAKLNCPGKTSKDMMVCFKGKSLKDIEIARVALQGFSEDPAVPFAPVVEKWAQKEKAVIPDTPQKLLADGKAAHVPWLTGFNSLNGLNLAVANIITTPKRLSQLDQEWPKLAPLLFHYGQSSAPNPTNISEQVKQYYFGNGKISEENREKLVIALTDRNFVDCTAQAALVQSRFAPVYVYTLNYQGTNSFLNEWGVADKLKMRGVVHNDELPFLFNIGLQSFSELKKGDKDTPFSEKMIKIWKEFARTGKPVERTEKGEVEWSSVLPTQSSSALKWYHLDSTTLSLARTLESPTFKVWESFDLGEEAYPSKDNGKIVVGYAITAKPPVHPITPASGKISPNSANIQHPGLKSPGLIQAVAGSTQKPVSAPGGLSYGIAPGAVSSLPSSSSSTTTTTSKPSTSTSKSSTSTTAVPAPAIHAVFKDEDPYSSTTTTTTKKPGFFSKILG